MRKWRGERGKGRGQNNEEPPKILLNWAPQNAEYTPVFETTRRPNSIAELSPQKAEYIPANLKQKLFQFTRKTPSITSKMVPKPDIRLVLRYSEATFLNVARALFTTCP